MSSAPRRLARGDGRASLPVAMLQSAFDVIVAAAILLLTVALGRLSGILWRINEVLAQRAALDQAEARLRAATARLSDTIARQPPIRPEDAP